MNKRGQSLILFVIFLPVIVVALVYVVDVSNSYYLKNKGNNLLEEAINNNLNIEKYFEDNDVIIESLDFKDNCYKIKYKQNTIFGNIIGKDYFDIEINKCIE